MGGGSFPAGLLFLLAASVLYLSIFDHVCFQHGLGLLRVGYGLVILGERPAPRVLSEWLRIA